MVGKHVQKSVYIYAVRDRTLWLLAVISHPTNYSWTEWEFNSMKVSRCQIGQMTFGVVQTSLLHPDAFGLQDQHLISILSATSFPKQTTVLTWFTRLNWRPDTLPLLGAVENKAWAGTAVTSSFHLRYLGAPKTVSLKVYHLKLRESTRTCHPYTLDNKPGSESGHIQVQLDAFRIWTTKKQEFQFCQKEKNMKKQHIHLPLGLLGPGLFKDSGLAGLLELPV